MAYPTEFDSLADLADVAQQVTVAFWNEERASIRNTQAALGLAVNGTADTVAARLDAIEASIASISGGGGGGLGAPDWRVIPAASLTETSPNAWAKIYQTSQSFTPASGFYVRFQTVQTAGEWLFLAATEELTALSEPYPAWVNTGPGGGNGLRVFDYWLPATGSHHVAIWGYSFSQGFTRSQLSSSGNADTATVLSVWVV